MTKSQAPNYKQITISNDQKSKDTHCSGLLKFQYCKSFIICNLVIGTFTWTGTVRAETIRLRSGQTIEGTVVERAKDSVKVDTGVGISITYYLDEIESIIRSPQPPAISAEVLPAPAVTRDSALTLDTHPPAPISIPSTRTVEGKIFLDNTAPSSPLWDAPRQSRDEYLKTQAKRTRAVEQEYIDRIILPLTGYLTSRWRGLKSAHPLIRTIAEDPAGPAIAIIFWAGVYALLCYPLMRLSLRFQCGGWMAWIPILNVFQLLRVADKSPVWLLFFFFPFINLLAFLFVWMSIARRLEQSHRLGYLMLVPGVNLFVLWYLAMLPNTSTAPKKQDNIDTGIKFE